MNSIGPASLSGWSARYLNNQRQANTEIGNGDLLKPRPALGTPLRNEAVDPAFYDSFMLQITFTLPGDVASDVEGEGATIAQSGEDATVAFTVLPGQDADLTLTAKVRNFKMPGAQIAALP